MNRGTDGQIELIMQQAAMNERAGSRGHGPGVRTLTQDRVGLCVCMCKTEREGHKYILPKAVRWTN